MNAILGWFLRHLSWILVVVFFAGCAPKGVHPGLSTIGPLPFVGSPPAPGPLLPSSPSSPLPGPQQPPPASPLVAVAVVSAAPANVVADGVTPAFITIHVARADGSPLEGASVALRSTGSTTLLQQPAATDASGDAKGLVASTVAGRQTIQAEVRMGGALVGTASADLSFVPGPVSAATSTLVLGGEMEPADGETPCAITVAARDALGNAVPRAAVVIEATGTANTIGAAAPTDANGVTEGTIASTALETKTITATITGGGGSATLTGTIAFANPTPGYPASVKISPTPASGVRADGVAVSTLPIQVKDARGKAVVGASVVLSATGAGDTITQPGLTDANGNATGRIASTAAGSKTITAVVTNPLGQQTGTTTVVFVAGPLSASGSTLTAAPASTLADGTSAVSLIAVACDATGNRIPNVTVRLTATGTGDVLTQPARTDATGTATGRLASTVAEAKTITATLTTGGTSVTLTTTARFVGTPSAALSSIRATPAAGLLADGIAASSIALVIHDANGVPIPGVTVSLAASGAGNTLTQPAATDATGATSGSIVSTIPETKAITATVTVGATQLTLATSVTFAPKNPASLANSTILVAPSSLPADGAATASISITVKDALGAPIVGAAVALSASGAATIAPPPLTDASGTAAGSIASTLAGSQTITANVAGVALVTSVTFTPLPFDLASSSAQASPTTVLADGVATASIIVTVKNRIGAPVPGVLVTLAASGTGWTIAPPSATTDANGVVLATVASTIAETKTILVALDQGSGPQLLPSSPAVSFVTTRMPRYAFVPNAANGSISVYAVDSSTGALRSKSYTLVGTGPSSVAVDTSGTFLYAADSGTNDVSVLSVGPGGFLRRIATTPAGTSPWSIALHPSGKFAYVVDRASNDVSAYRIGADGLLAALPRVATGVSPRAIALDAGGRFAYVAEGGANAVSQFAIDPVSGALSFVSRVTTGVTPTALAVDSGASALHVANAGSNDVWSYSLSATTGAPTLAGTSPAGTAPGGLAVDPVGHHVYVASTASSDVRSFAAAAGGRLTLVATLAVAGSPAGVAVDPSAQFVYVSQTASDQVATFTILANGSLAAASSVVTQGSPGAPAFSSGAAGISETPRFVIAGNRSTNDLSVYSVAATGGLTPAGANVLTGTQPRGEAIDPQQRFLFVANAGSNDIYTYAIDPIAGTLSQLAITPSPGTGTLNVIVDPSGRFLVCLDDVSNDLAVFTINANGTLTAVGLPVPTGITPQAIRFHPSGRFLYCAEFGSDDVRTFSVNLATGALTALGLPLSTGVNTGPGSFAFDPSGRFAYCVNSFVDPVTAASPDTLDIFSVDPVTGALALVSQIPSGGIEPFALEVAASGRFAYCVNLGTPSITSFALNPATGALTLIGTAATTNAPEHIVLATNGASAYVSNRRANDVEEYSIAADGTLVLSGTVPAGVQPRSLILLETAP